MAQFIPLGDAVAAHIHDGDCVAFEGFTHLIPHAAVHETIRQGITDLTVVRLTPDIVHDQLIGMGRVKKIIFSYAGNPGVGLLRRMRDAIETGWPRPLEICEHSHAALANAYEAGAAGLPCAVLRAYKGTDLPNVNDDIQSVTCPFTGEELAAVRAVNPDVAVIHAQKASRRGDVLIEGIISVQKEAVLSAKRSIVTVEEIVDDLSDVHPNCCVLPHWTVSAICIVPGGAHPSYAQGYYARDNAAYLEWDRISADRDVFLAWMEEHVMAASPADFDGRVAVLRNARP
ncbi:MAG: CoA transferase subunit A [Alphaproteobacteria bacterium]